MIPQRMPRSMTQPMPWTMTIRMAPTTSMASHTRRGSTSTASRSNTRKRMSIRIPQVSVTSPVVESEQNPNYFVIARNSCESCQFLRRMSASFLALSGSRLAFSFCAFLIFFFSHSGLSCILAIVSPSMTGAMNSGTAPYPHRTLSTRGSPSSPPAVSCGTRCGGQESWSRVTASVATVCQVTPCTVAPRSFDRGMNLGTPSQEGNRDSAAVLLAPVTAVTKGLSRQQKYVNPYIERGYMNHWRYSVATLAGQLV
jgi:hypothetical protein